MLSLIFALALLAQSSGPPAGLKSTPAPASALTTPAAAAKPTPLPPVPKGEIQGVVLQPDGKPAPKARVGFIAILALGQIPPAPAIITTDGQGAFRFETRGVKEYAVRAHLAPFATTAQPRVAGGTRVTLKLDAGIAVTGEIRDASSGSAIAGASLRAADWDVSPYDEADPDFAIARAKSDAKGRFILSGVSGGGRPTIRVQARGYASETVPVGGAPIRFRLSPGHDVRGTVMDRAGRPVPGATLTFRAASSSVSARSDANGKFEASGLKDVPYDGTVIAADFTPLVRSTIGPEVVSWPVTLDKASIVTGRMVDEDGKPLKGAVRLRSHEGSPIPNAFGRLANPPFGEDGVFKITALRPGSNVLVFAGAGYPSFEKTVEIAQAGETVALGDVAFAQGLALRARIVEKGEVPVAGARLTAVLPRQFESSEVIFAEADAEGRLTLRGLKERTYDIQVQAQGLASLQTSLQPSADEQLLVMKRALKITGRFVDPEGLPVGRVQVTMQVGEDRRSSRSAQSAGDGRFTVELGDTGETTLTAAVESFERLSRKLQINGDTELEDVVLSRGLRIRGVVVDGKGAAIPGARVENQSTRQFPVTFSETDDKGAFDLRGATPGRVRLIASHRDYSPTQSSVDTPEAGGDPDPIRIALSKGGRVEGVVRWRDGSPVSQARVELSRFGGPQSPRPSNAGQDSVVTGADGTFAFDRLAPGTGRVTLMAGANGSFQSVTGTEVAIVEGETAQIALTVRSTIVRGTVRRSGRPGEGLRIAVNGETFSMSGGPDTASSLRGEIPWTVTTTDAQGRFAVQVAAPLKGRAQVNDFRGQGLYSKAVDIPDVDEFALNLEFGAARATGRVIDATTGLGIAEARVVASSAGKLAPNTPVPSTSGVTERTGEFSLDLEPGPYRLGVTAPDYMGANSSVTISPSDNALGDIALDHGGTFLGRMLLPTGRPAPDVSIRAVAAPLFSIVFSTSAADGTFALKGLPAGPFFLTANDTTDHIAVLKVDALSTEVVDIRLALGVRINVTVHGNPQEFGSTSVSVSQVNGENYVGSLAARPDARGQALLVAPPGSLTLVVRSPTHGGTVAVQGQAGETINVTIEMQPNPVQTNK